MTDVTIDVADTGAGGLFEERAVATPSDDTAQWRASALQLVNWGGFGGVTVVPLGGDTTMISGASGVGKSTILDAYTALMMPSDTKFNGASNDAVAGRARSAGQRNLLSYLRGAVDVVDDPRTGRPIEQLLRGKGVDTWGAVAMTFVNDTGGRFTALRTYYVPRRATRSSDVAMTLLTLDGSLDLATLEAGVPDRLHATTIKKLFPGIRVHRTYAEFAAVLHARLGIGANGDGAKALRLLARIQAGNQVRSVDELYKDMVLERPSTYAAADRAVEHFDDLDSAHTAMRTEQQKLEVLEPISDLQRRKELATKRAAELDAFGVTLAGETPLRLWLLRTHQRLLASAVETNRAERTATVAALAAGVSAEKALQREVEAAKQEHRAAGGADLQSLGSLLEHEHALREQRAGRRGELQQRMLPLLDVTDPDNDRIDGALDTAASFAALQGEAQRWLRDEERRREELTRRLGEMTGPRYQLQQRKSDLQRERQSLEQRAGRVPIVLDELRSAVATAAGMGVDELPFVAELIDVAPEEARWRAAIETVLGGSARIMLVPLHRLEEFSTAIDGLRLRGRLTFEGAELDLPPTGPDDPERIAGKLLFKDSPFSGWVQAHVAESSRNALCVETTDGLAGPGNRVTLAGQTRSGRRGSHGRSDTRNIIGFSNEDALADLDAELASVEAELRELDAAVAEVERTIRVAGQTRSAYDAVVMARFDDVDVAGSDARIADIERRRAEILGSDDQLEALERQIEELTGRLEDARRQRFGLEQERDRLGLQHEELVDSEDKVNDQIEAMEAAGAVEVDDEQDAALRAELAAAVAPADPEDLDRFHEHSQRLQERLRGAVGDSEAEIARVEEELLRIFRHYKSTWDSPNLAATVDSYADYARILEDIRGKGLADRRAEWRRRLTEWSGQDLVPLLGAMSQSIEEIEDRLGPINEILRRLDFGATGDRLRIRLRRLAPAHVQAFLKDLRTLSSGSAGALAEEDLEKRFADLSRFMHQLRPTAPGAEGPRTATGCSTSAGTWRSAPSATTR